MEKDKATALKGLLGLGIGVPESSAEKQRERMAEIIFYSQMFPHLFEQGEQQALQSQQGSTIGGFSNLPPTGITTI